MVEMLIVMAIFSIIMAGAMNAFTSQFKHSTQEYKLAESEVELGIAKNIITRDLEMGGYGLAENYGAAVPAITGNIVGFSATDNASAGAPDELKIRGTALGLQNRAAQAWSFVNASDGNASAAPPTGFQAWSDARENLQTGDAVIFLEPSSRQLQVQGSGTRNWLFRHNGNPADPTLLETGTASAFPVGTVVYGIGKADAADPPLRPYYAVRYYLGANADRAEGCVNGTASLLRAESNKAEDIATLPNGGVPVLDCVRSFQVAFGLDRDENGTIETWDDGGADYLNSYDNVQMRKRLKQVRVYLLMQASNRDDSYNHSPATIKVGDTLAGEEVTLTTEQRKYRWRLVTLSVTPRNVR